MTIDASYQNPEQINPNPLAPTTDSSNKLPLKKVALPKDPRIKALIVLGIIVLVLTIISLVVTSTRRQSPVIHRTNPTPTIVTSPTPTDIPEASTMPQDLKAKFDEVYRYTQINVDFNPPQIDVSIGL